MACAQVRNRVDDAPAGAFVVEDLLEFGRGLRAFLETQVGDAANVGDLRVGAFVGSRGLEQFDGLCGLIFQDGYRGARDGIGSDAITGLHGDVARPPSAEAKPLCGLLCT